MIGQMHAHDHKFFLCVGAAMSPGEVPNEEIAQAIDTTIQHVAEPVKVRQVQPGHAFKKLHFSLHHKAAGPAPFTPVCPHLKSA